MDISTILEKLAEAQTQAEKEITSADSLENLNEIRVKWLGKKGQITHILKDVGSLSNEDKPIIGKRGNEVKSLITAVLEKRREKLNELILQKELDESSLDMTLPGRDIKNGSFHPISILIDRIINIFTKMGYTTVDGLELETEYYCFDALNILADHPARDDHDSFYVGPKQLLRTQTSTAQIRVMQQVKPPIAIVHPGRCFRRDAVDATHNHTFYQVEGLLVDKDVSFAHLKATLFHFAQQLFGPDTKVRLRPDFFPFTEPSGEFQVTCFNCGGTQKDCKVCKGSGWLELGGCGLVDPEVLQEVGIDPQIYSGFAFGIGIERLAMNKFGIPDIRLFYENDIRFLQQFANY
jgi:phenylalanyl-tRNA synthetase alpha chain